MVNGSWHVAHLKSFVEAHYNVICKWCCNLLWCFLRKPPNFLIGLIPLYAYNTSIIQIATSPKFHERAKWRVEMWKTPTRNSRSIAFLMVGSLHGSPASESSCEWCMTQGSQLPYIIDPEESRLLKNSLPRNPRPLFLIGVFYLGIRSNPTSYSIWLLQDPYLIYNRSSLLIIMGLLFSVGNRHLLDQMWDPWHAGHITFYAKHIELNYIIDKHVTDEAIHLPHLITNWAG